ncbi:putative kolobok-17 hm [Trichonephila clavipes]|nr:putative kolobok-17 hm [Trichonephila clavipes]
MHNENCKANHFGNSGSMEVSGAIEIFQRSESLHAIEKLECIGYVEKYMGTRLRALKLKMKGKKLSDKKTLDDHGRLAGAEIDKLQRYYGLIIKNNTDSINSINSMYR